MSRDPYIDVKREVEQNLSITHSLLDSYDRLTSTASSGSTSSTVIEARDELRGTLSLLETDLEDLEESVRVVETMGDRWGLGEGEIKKRRKFVEGVKRDVRGLRGKVFGRDNSKNKGKGKQLGRYRDLPEDEIDLERGGDPDTEEVKRWEREEQQMLVQRQDDTLGVISGTLHNLASQAGLIGSEVNEQSEMLDDLSTRVDHTDSRLRKVSKTMQDFIRRNEETKSGWCIGILIVILMILLLLVIIT